VPEDSERASRTLKMIIRVLHILCNVLLYLGAATVCVGALIMKRPEHLPVDLGSSAAMTGIIVLITIFFAVYFVHGVFYVLQQTRSFFAHHRKVGIFILAQDAVNIAPMLCILFIAVQMRALQVDPPSGKPQPWAQGCMVACVAVIVFKVMCAVVLPLLDPTGEGDVTTQGEREFRFQSNLLRIISDVAKNVSMLLVLAMAIAIMVAAAQLQSPNMVPPVSTAMRCGVILSSMYFLEHTLLFIIRTIQSHRPGTRLDWIVGVLESGHKVVMFAPVLCSLFLSARLRALQLTLTVDGDIPPTAGPQEWVQACMSFITYSILVSVAMAYIVASMLGTSTKVITSDTSLAKAGMMIKYVSFILMYVCTFVIVIGIFIMTPDSLPPYST